MACHQFCGKTFSSHAIPGQPGHALASMGIYVFNASFLFEQLIHDHDDEHSSHDFGKDLIPYLVPRGPGIRPPLFRQLCQHGVGCALLARCGYH